MQLDFNQLAERIQQMEGKLIKASIVNRGRHYRFHSLKPSGGFNPDICGVGLNHAFQTSGNKRSRFHDREDVDIAFRRDEFVFADAVKDGGDFVLYVKTRNFSCKLEVSGQATGS